MGVRLQGPSLPVDPGAADRASFGVLPGAIQVPPDGQPIVLLVDAQPTGGYPVPAVVARVDLHLLAQLRPGDTVRFAPVARLAAVAALRAAVLQDPR
jgi:antagonist of KipI